TSFQSQTTQRNAIPLQYTFDTLYPTQIPSPTPTMSPSTNLRLVLQILQLQLQRQLQQQRLNLMVIQAHDSAMDLANQPQVPAQIQGQVPILAFPQDEGSVFLEDIMVDVTHNPV
ncbi:hypothetical protein BGZ54_001084, partial [Gamsiella multidivaricata]